MNTLTDGDKAYIAFITGNNCHNYVWTLLSIFGAGEIYGGTGAPTHLSLEEQDAHLEMWEMQYQDPRWKARSQSLIEKRRCCAKCGSNNSLQAHHLVYLSDKMLWEYEDEQLEVLCEKCHLNEHGLQLLADGTKVLK